MNVPQSVSDADKILGIYYDLADETSPAPKTARVIEISGLPVDYAYKLIETIEYHLFIIRESMNSGGPQFNNYRITNSGKQFQRANGFTQLHLNEQAGINDAINEQIEVKEIKALEKQKLMSENILLVDQIIDYPIVKRQKRIAYYVAAVTILLTIISTWIAIAQYLKCK